MEGGREGERGKGEINQLVNRGAVAVAAILMGQDSRGGRLWHCLY